MRHKGVRALGVTRRSRSSKFRANSGEPRARGWVGGMPRRRSCTSLARPAWCRRDGRTLAIPSQHVHGNSDIDILFEPMDVGSSDVSECLVLRSA